MTVIVFYGTLSRIILLEICTHLCGSTRVFCKKKTNNFNQLFGDSVESPFNILELWLHKLPSAKFSITFFFIFLHREVKRRKKTHIFFAHREIVH